MDHFVVVGAGQAGSSLVAKLRTQGFGGRITLIGAEPELPYQRPPLSKAYLLGEMERERLYLRPRSFYDELSIDLKLGEPVSAIDPDKRLVTVGDEVIEYDKLAITVGLTPRRLSPEIGGTLSGVHIIRTLADVDALYEPIRKAKSALVVGGGYIGLEGASVARKLGLEVTIVEMAERILNRVAAPETADFIRDLHQRHGVVVREGVGLKRLLGSETVSGAELADGSTIDADIVIAGIGMDGQVPLAEEAGLECDGGIVVNEYAQSSDPNIFAAGDCTRQPFRGTMIRLESVQNAIDQGEAAAVNMMGTGQIFEPKPWFWSDQYDCHLQIAGFNMGYDRIVKRPSDGEHCSFWYYEGNTLRAVDAMSDARAYMVGKRLIEAGKSPDPKAICDPTVDLKTLLRA